MFEYLFRRSSRDIRLQLSRFDAEEDVVLDLSDVGVTDKDCSIIADFVAKHSQIESLILRGNEVTGKGLSILANSLQLHCPNLTSLDLSINNLDDKAASSLASECHLMLMKLQHLDLSFNLIGDNGITAIMAALKPFSSLKHLDLATTAIGDKGAQVIAEFLTKDLVLEVLDVSENEITEAGVQSIAEALAMHPSLHTVSLRGCQVGMSGSKALARSIVAESPVRKLNLRNCGLSVGEALNVVQALAESQLRILDLSYNDQVDDEVVEALSQVIVVNKFLRKVNFSFNSRISQRGVDSLLAAVQSNSTINCVLLEGIESAQNAQLQLSCINP